MDLSFLMVFLKKYFVNTAKRQNFDDASGQIFSSILRPCLMGCAEIMILMMIMIVMSVMIMMRIYGFLLICQMIMMTSVYQMMVKIVIIKHIPGH